MDIERKISHHKRQARKWTDTAQRTAGLNDKWHLRALRQANWHSLQVTNLIAEQNGWS